jgi:hypothetical protein
MKVKKIPKEISDYYRELGKKSVKARHAKILEKIKNAKLDTEDSNMS